MFPNIGIVVSRAAILVIAGWFAFFALVWWLAPARNAVSQDGEFVFLPEDSDSREAERLYRQAFPPVDSHDPTQENELSLPAQQDPLGSNLAVVVQREHVARGLSKADETFIEEQLRPALVTIMERTPAGYLSESPGATAELMRQPPIPDGERIIRGIWTRTDSRIGPLLVSSDRQATLVIVELSTEFLDRGNALAVSRVENVLASLRLPSGLAVQLSGSATVGRDMLRAEVISSSRTELYTKVLVVILLLVIYRAPILALIPLLTVGLAVEVSLYLLRIMAGWGWIGLFNGLDVYVTVVVYGAGVDYCLFLIARYKEELDAGATFQEAISRSIHMVGAALATSAGTSIFGIGMMGFAEFGKFRQAGFAIAFGLFVVLCCSLTFTPAMLSLFRGLAFWPESRRERISADEGWIPTSSLSMLVGEQKWLDRFWNWVSDLLRRRPGIVFVSTIAAMLPAAVLAVVVHDRLSYGLLSDLPVEEPSVQGAAAVQRHFPAGIAGVTTVLVRVEGLEPSLTLGRKLSDSLTTHLMERDDELGIVDIRSERHPLGLSPIAEEFLDSLRQQFGIVAANRVRTSARQTYSSTRGPLAGTVFRIDIVFNVDPFARDSIARLDTVEQAIREALPAVVADDPDEFPADLVARTDVLTLGPTASIRDLKLVTDRDQIRIDVLVVIAVYFVLIALLRRPAVCAYLIVTVAFSYLVTLGVTYTVFYLRDPAVFAGLDWKVPIYLFTLLLALGEDYNVLLMSRVTEEQETHGPVEGVLVALTKTGGIISSCGVIMAGTFCSLMTGTLMGMVQLGFALAFGVLLDTFVIRPILVPAYLVMLHGGRFGRFGKLLGAEPDLRQPVASPVLEESTQPPVDSPASV